MILTNDDFPVCEMCGGEGYVIRNGVVRDCHGCDATGVTYIPPRDYKGELEIYILRELGSMGLWNRIPASSTEAEAWIRMAIDRVLADQGCFAPNRFNCSCCGERADFGVQFNPSTGSASVSARCPRGCPPPEPDVVKLTQKPEPGRAILDTLAGRP